MIRGKGAILIAVLLCAVAVFIFLKVKQEQGRPSMPDMAPEGRQAESAAPDISLTDASGKVYKLSDLKGSVVFINFWATWCQPCREEAPSIQSLHERFKNEKKFRMLTVLYKDDYQRSLDFMKNNKYGFPVLEDPGGKTALSYGVTGVPETYIVSKGGILKERVIGPADWNSPEAISLIANLIKE